MSPQGKKYTDETSGVSLAVNNEKAVKISCIKAGKGILFF